MRTTSLALLALTTATLAAGKPAEGGSIEALLERISQRNHPVSASARASAAREEPKSETSVPPTAPPAASKEKEDVPAKKDEPEAPKEGHRHESKRSAHGKMAKRVRAKADEENAKRWVWATGIIQDDTPASAAPAVGSNANLLSSSTTIPAGTPAATLIAPSFPPLPQSSSTTPPAAPATTTPARRPTWKSHSVRAKREEDNEKRWVWSNQIIQDDTPAAQAPPVGQNVNALQSPAVAATTPAAHLVAPSFPPKEPAAVNSTAAVTSPSAAVKVASAAASSSAAAKKRPTWHIARDVEGHEDPERRWVWGNSIIQDDTPAASAPPVGENVNQLSSSAYSVTTPAATLVAPSFPPVQSSSQTPGPSPSSSSSVVLTSSSTSSVAVDAAVTPVSSSSTVTAAAAAQSTSAAHSHWWDPKQLLEDIEEGFEKLFHHSSSATAVPVQTSGVEKRWVWATGIIQDDTPAAEVPAVGENANLLSSPTYAATTPAATLVAPSFPPKVASSSASSSSTTTPAQASPSTGAVRAAVGQVSSVSSAAAAETSVAHNARLTWRQAHEAALRAAASKKAAQQQQQARATASSSASSAKAAETKSAAQQWYRADPKAKKMAKRSRK
ncbi:hypothetical protein JCM10213_002058 [Rhodosporidiobolus nylandii]